jgi:hypothetical protein
MEELNYVTHQREYMPFGLFLLGPIMHPKVMKAHKSNIDLQSKGKIDK